MSISYMGYELIGTSLPAICHRLSPSDLAVDVQRSDRCLPKIVREHTADTILSGDSLPRLPHV